MGQDFEVYIDYAHTPNALDKVLTLLRKRLSAKGEVGKLITVFGCAGERDVEKRPMMGEISTNLSDVSIFTAEDPRTEDVNRIIDQISEGAIKTKAQEITNNNFNRMNQYENKHLFFKIPDRSEAIIFALRKIAQKGDIVVICGKGHEKSTAYGDIELPWNEEEVITYALKSDPKRAIVVFAAGQGTRMNMNYPKVLLKLAGREMIFYTLENLRKAGFAEIVLVVGYKKELVIKTVGPGVTYAFQKKQLGTGDALNTGIRNLNSKFENIVAVNGDDSAFYNPATIRGIYDFHKKSNNMVTITSAILDDPYGIGRIIRDNQGKIVKVVEEKEATSVEKKIKESNIGLYAFNFNWLTKNIKKIKKSTTGEYYVVDLVKIAIDGRAKVGVYKVDKLEWFGINTPEQLNLADKKIRKHLEKLSLNAESA